MLSLIKQSLPFYVDIIDFKSHLLFTGVSGYMEHISNQH